MKDMEYPEIYQLRSPEVKFSQLVKFISQDLKLALGEILKGTEGGEKQSRKSEIEASGRDWKGCARGPNVHWAFCP